MPPKGKSAVERCSEKKKTSDKTERKIHTLAYVLKEEVANIAQRRTAEDIACHTADSRTEIFKNLAIAPQPPNNTEHLDNCNKFSGKAKDFSLISGNAPWRQSLVTIALLNKN